MVSETVKKAKEILHESIPAVRRLDELKDNPLNPRGVVEDLDSAMEELIASIKSHGLLQPLVITPNNVVVAGHRRKFACIAAGLDKVQVVIRNLTETEQLEVMLIENMQRQNLNSVQIAQSFQKLHESGLAVEEIAEKVGYGKDTVRKHLDLLKLAKPLHQKFANNELALGYVRHLLEVSEADQIKLAEKAIKGNWLINQMSAAVQAILRPPEPPPTENELKQWKVSEIQERLRRTRNELAEILDKKDALIFIGKAEDVLIEYLRNLRREG